MVPKDSDVTVNTMLLDFLVTSWSIYNTPDTCIVHKHITLPKLPQKSRIYYAKYFFPKKTDDKNLDSY